MLPPVVLTVEDGPEQPEEAAVPLHKKNASVGTKTTIRLRVRAACAQNFE